MRVLFAERERRSRFVPLVEALLAAGHEVVVASAEPTTTPGAGSVRFLVRTAAPDPPTGLVAPSSGEAIGPGAGSGGPVALPPDLAVRTGQVLLRILAELRPRFCPDVVVAVAAEGSGLFVSEADPAPSLVSVLDGYRDAGRAGPGGTMVALAAAMHSTAAVCPTSFQRSQFPWFLQHKLTVLPFGVPVGFFAPSPEGAEPSGRPTSATTLGRPGDELVVAHCPQASPADGMTALARGLAALLRERARPSARAVLVVDGPPPVDPLALDGGLDPARLHLVLAPDAQQRLELHRAAAVHLVVGVRSPRPDLLLEAQACGGLVVAAGPGMTDTVQHGVTGYLAAPEGRSLAELANWVLDHRSRLGEVRRAARQFVVAGFDEVVQSRRWAELLARVHAQAAPPASAFPLPRPQGEPSPAQRADGHS